jgi:hypothetical protein
MKNFFKSMTLLLLLGAVCCDPTKPEIENEEELITTVKLSLVPKGGGSTIELFFKDLDGDGGKDPIIQGGILENGKVYNGKLIFLDETTSPSKDISEEILKEAEDHQVFYSPSADLKDAVAINYSDKDLNSNPIGLLTEFTTKKSGKGNLKITLRHKLSKGNSGVKEGDISNAGGETDIEITLPLDIN